MYMIGGKELKKWCSAWLIENTLDYPFNKTGLLHNHTLAELPFNMPFICDHHLKKHKKILAERKLPSSDLCSV